VFVVAGAMILIVSFVLLLTGSMSYWDWLKCQNSPCGLPTGPFDNPYLTTGLVITPVGMASLVIGIKKQI